MSLFFFNDPASTHIHAPCLHDALPIRSEEHTSELQSRSDLVCRLLLEKKKTTIQRIHIICTREGRGNRRRLKGTQTGAKFTAGSNRTTSTTRNNLISELDR